MPTYYNQLNTTTAKMQLNKNLFRDSAGGRDDPASHSSHNNPPQQQTHHQGTSSDYSIMVAPAVPPNKHDTFDSRNLF